MFGLISVILQIFNYLLRLVKVLIIIRAVISWIPMNTYNPFCLFIINVTEVFLAPIRKFCSRFASLGMFDFSPIIAYILIEIIGIIINGIISSLFVF